MPALADFATAHGLEPRSRPELPPLTPLLGRGDRRLTEAAASGALPGGIDGELAHFTYIDVDDDGPDRHYPYTVVLTSVPESIGFVPTLYCTPRGRFGSFTIRGFGDEDTMQRPDRRLEFESEALSDRYAIRVDAEVGENWARQLFSPGFITWLAHESTEDLSFELEHGALCVYVPGTLEAEGDLKRFCEDAAEITKRIRGEALEEEGRIEAGAAALPDKPEESLAAEVERGMREVEWRVPPADAATAIKAYRRPSMREWEPWVYGVGTLIGGLLIGGLLLLADEGQGLLIGLATPFVAAGVWRKYVGDRAKALGKAAFARGYASSRGLREENPRLFQARNMRLRFPGVAEAALSGALPGGGREATLAFTAAGRSKARKDFDVLVASLPAGVTLPEGGAIGDGLEAAAHGGTIAIWAPSEGDAKRSAAGLDRFAGRATAALERLSRPGADGAR